MTSITTGNERVFRISAPDPGEELLAALNAGGSPVARVGSTGLSAMEPLLMVTERRRTAFHAACSPELAADIVSERADAFDGRADAIVDHDPGTTSLPAPDLRRFDTGPRDLLGACGWRRPTAAADHEAAGGFGPYDADAVLKFGAKLAGRGWGDWCQDDPVAPAWNRVRRADGGATLVVNAHGNPADALLLSSAPFEVLDGAQSVAGAVGGDRIVVYASVDDERAIETVREAARNYQEPPVPVAVVAGPADHRAAEPTMALEAIEGNHRLEARLRPPGPETFGLHGDPTLVHTARTYAHLAVALRTGALPGTRLVTVRGDVTSPATVELSETEPLSRTLDVVDIEGTFWAACVGGRFGGVTSDLEVEADPAALADRDLGTEGTVEVLSDDRCVVEFVGKRAGFAAEENCGRCVPCREGTTQLRELLRDVYEGRYDPGGIDELIRVMETSSICTFGVDAGRPVRTAMAAFASEFEAHADGRCPAGRCLEPPATPDAGSSKVA